jgi:hypothetical protein
MRVGEAGIAHRKSPLKLPGGGALIGDVDADKSDAYFTEAA